MDATLQATRRGDKGKNEARRHRAAGRVPGVVYGPVAGGAQGAAVPITVDPKALSRILHSESGANTIISLQLEGDADTQVLVKEYQLDPVTRDLLHADFYRVAMDKVIIVTVPVVLKGEARGVKQQGGVLDFVTRQIEVETLPTEIPERIEVDVTELVINEGVRLRDVAGGQRWTAITDVDTLLVHVVAPRTEEAAAPAVEAAPAAGEPEVIKKGKTEKEEEKG